MVLQKSYRSLVIGLGTILARRILLSGRRRKCRRRHIFDLAPNGTEDCAVIGQKPNLRISIHTYVAGVLGIDVHLGNQLTFRWYYPGDQVTRSNYFSDRFRSKLLDNSV